MLVSEGNMHGDAPWRDVERLLVRRFDLEPGDILIVVGDPEGAGREAKLRRQPFSGKWRLGGGCRHVAGPGGGGWPGSS